MATLQIELEDLSRPEWRALYVGDRTRYATVGAVRFLDDRTLVCSSLLGCMMYLVRFDLGAGNYEVIDRVETTYGGRSTQTDLCDTDGRGLVVTSNCENASLSLYRAIDDEIHHVRDIVALPGNFCHGARFCGPDVVVATTLRPPRGVHFFDLRTARELLYVPTDRLPKDVCFLPDGRAALITTEGVAESAKFVTCRRSEVVVVEFDLTRGTHAVVGRQTYDAGQLDAAVEHDGKLYCVDTQDGRVLVVDASSLRQVGQIDGLDFPHGIDINYGMMAIACYGTNAVHVTPLSEVR